MAAEGIEVTGFDLHAREDLDVRQVTGDLLDAESVKDAADGHEVICHIGAIGDVYLAATDPALAASVNVTGSANVAAAAKATGARIVYASTWEVYGDPHYEPVDEEHPCEPDHPYNITKLAGERMLIAYDRLQNVPVVALRLGTAYGPGMRPNSVFEVFINKAKNGEPITIQGDGSQGRQFTHADDIARAFTLAAQSDIRGMPFNIVSSEMISIKQLAERVSEKYPTEVTYSEPRPGDVTPSYVSADRALEHLGWEATVGFEEGIGRMLEASSAESGQ